MKKPMLYLALAFAALYGMYSCTKENKVLSDQQLAKSTLSSLADSIPIDTIDTIPTDTIPTDTLHDSIPLITNRLVVQPQTSNSYLGIIVRTWETYNYDYVAFSHLNLINSGALTFGVTQPYGHLPHTTTYSPAQMFIAFHTTANGSYPFKINFKNVNYSGRIHVTDSGYRFNWHHDSTILVYPKFVHK
ncbi:hypothetical protein ACQKLP_01765 [Chitinophaga sp. NPDC101104]|uniref:hypothetical protein n=1 Tax=Chitinophaga sp. NPDC101104 TaxID=3390561 RepID=UPI003CFE5AFE